MIYGYARVSTDGQSVAAQVAALNAAGAGKVFVAGAIGPVLMGWVFDATASYQTLLIVLAAGTLGAAALMQWMPRYPNQT